MFTNKILTGGFSICFKQVCVTNEYRMWLVLPVQHSSTSSSPGKPTYLRNWHRPHTFHFLRCQLYSLSVTIERSDLFLAIHLIWLDWHAKS